MMDLRTSGDGTIVNWDGTTLPIMYKPPQMAQSMNPADHLNCMMMHITTRHFNYLYVTENLQKLEEKKKVEGHIRDYLMIAPHYKKFYFDETSIILHNTVQHKENFSAIRASAALNAIDSYAQNLLGQPWRKEFQEIQTYSGFYKHNVDNGLHGSELLLNLMGYQETDKGIYTLDGPVDPDKLADVSRDCLVASVECQILNNVYAELLRNGYNFRWIDILEYREACPCSGEQAFHGLINQYNQRFMNSCRPECYSKCTLLDHGLYNPTPTPYRAPINTQFPYYRDVPDSIQMVQSCHCTHSANPLNKCTVCHKDYSVNSTTRQSNACSVPTAQLIELDVSYEGKDNYIYDKENHQKTLPERVDARNSSLNLSDSNSNQFKYRHGKDSGWDTWRPGYQLQDNKKSSTSVEQKHLQGEDWEALKALRIDDAQPSTSTCEPKMLEKALDKSTKKKTKLYSTHGSQTLGREFPKKPDINATLKVKLTEKWECPTCTYHNTNDKDVCEMCSRSKIGGNDFSPLVSGGRQCPKCTLVNEKGVTVCDACATDLKDSPTYI